MRRSDPRQPPAPGWKIALALVVLCAAYTLIPWMVYYASH